MIFIDTKGFDRQTYQFEYVHREFLGEVLALSSTLRRGREPEKGGSLDASGRKIRTLQSCFGGMDTPVAGKKRFQSSFR
jgi:hypothetical protein